MRNIKFRGRRIDNEEWVYGCHTRYSEEVSYITVNFIENELYKVDAKTVGQYTGFKDNNKKEIYGGDKLKIVTHTDVINKKDKDGNPYYEDKPIYIYVTVVFHNGRWGLHLKGVSMNWSMPLYSFRGFRGFNMEVVNNK